MKNDISFQHLRTTHEAEDSATGADNAGVLCLGTWVTVLWQDMGDTSVGSGGDTCGLRLSGELR